MLLRVKQRCQYTSEDEDLCLMFAAQPLKDEEPLFIATFYFIRKVPRQTKLDFS